MVFYYRLLPIYILKKTKKKKDCCTSQFAVLHQTAEIKRIHHLLPPRFTVNWGKPKTRASEAVMGANKDANKETTVLTVLNH